MAEHGSDLNPALVRDSWDNAARAYAEGQAAGRDRYRYAFFGPAHVRKCGDVRGLRLMDIGCGSGYFAREMARAGANVTGTDVAPQMIEQARRQELESPLGIDFRVVDAADLAESFRARSFDIVTSCCALQDMPDIPRVLRAVREILTPGGRFVPSVVHPCADTPFREWERDATGRKRWLCIDRYFDREVIENRWLGWPYEFTTFARHLTLEDWFTMILDARFSIRALSEPRPTEQTLREYPDLEDAARVPYYLIFDLIS
jgi:2-polyprenyl-3-methyl-5-hydroxy-6-metoxy-1,4-benzoquinol methylase